MRPTGERLPYRWGEHWPADALTRVRVYALVNEHRFTGWVGTLVSDAISGSVRIEYCDKHDISGIDPLTIAPVKTADPDRQAIRRDDPGIGINLAGGRELRGWRL